MTTNRRKSSSLNRSRKKVGRCSRSGNDIEMIEFPNMISAKDFESMLKEHAPVHGVALGRHGSASRT